MADFKNIDHTVQGHKNNKCNSCGKNFSTSGYLKRHKYTVHEGHKDYKCETCGKFFTELQALENISILVMMDIQITNVNLAANHFLKQVI